MPPSSLSPIASKHSPDLAVDDAAQRKKKNADAQAAFRARRANYIATLEETGEHPRPICPQRSTHSLRFCALVLVTNLEKVVVTLQASCREATEDAAQLRSENTRLKSEARDREKFWRALWQARKTGLPPDPADATCLPSYAQSHPSPASSTSSGSAGLLSPTVTALDPTQDGRMRFAGTPTATLMASSQASNYGLSAEYPSHASASPSATATVAGSQGEPLGSPDSAAYTACAPYVADDQSREASWSPPDMYPVQDCKPHLEGTQSPTFVESPTATASELTYNTQYSTSIYHPAVVEATYTTEQSLYLFSPSRSVSPALTQASTTSTSSVSATSSSMASYPFTFPEGTAMQDHPHFSFRQQFTLRGGQANVATAETHGDALRHKLANRSMPGLARPPYVSHDHPSSSCAEDEYPSSDHSTPAAHFRRNTAPEALSNPPNSRSPSPGPHISGTLAIIKAQTFGALRRTRGRTRPSSEGLAKAAVQALASQGLGLGLVTGPPSKRPRLHGGAEGTQN
ncbi:hypothetical protein EIP86_002872 [Pleurotus ostreatoroseus]|nr:hypothetical protein EIP86_002872 [Pleurotus ostreatoroseus]